MGGRIVLEESTATNNIITAVGEGAFSAIPNADGGAAEAFYYRRTDKVI